jgi:hypothetical protein
MLFSSPNPINQVYRPHKRYKELNNNFLFPYNKETEAIMFSENDSAFNIVNKIFWAPMLEKQCVSNLIRKYLQSIPPFVPADYRSRLEFLWLKRRVSHLVPFRNGDNLAMKRFHTKDTLTRVEKIQRCRIISYPGRVIHENRNRIRRKTMDFSIVVRGVNKNGRKKVDK